MTKSEFRETYGISGREALRIERALCTLADHEGLLKHVGESNGLPNFSHAHGDVCRILREIADDWVDAQGD